MVNPARNLAESFARAMAPYRAGKLLDAERLCRQIILTNPNHFEATHILVLAQAYLDRHEQALANYNRALCLRPNDADVLNNRGNVLKAPRRYDDAVASYDRALALRPDHAEAHNNRGQVLKELMRYDEELASYDAALALQPEHVAAHCNTAAIPSTS